jgi:hypothetical protein
MLTFDHRGSVANVVGWIRVPSLTVAVTANAVHDRSSFDGGLYRSPQRGDDRPAKRLSRELYVRKETTGIFARTLISVVVDIDGLQRELERTEEPMPGISAFDEPLGMHPDDTGIGDGTVRVRPTSGFLPFDSEEVVAA